MLQRLLDFFRKFGKKNGSPPSDEGGVGDRVRRKRKEPSSEGGKEKPLKRKRKPVPEGEPRKKKRKPVEGEEPRKKKRKKKPEEAGTEGAPRKRKKVQAEGDELPKKRVRKATDADVPPIQKKRRKKPAAPGEEGSASLDPEKRRLKKLKKAGSGSLPDLSDEEILRRKKAVAKKKRALKAKAEAVRKELDVKVVKGQKKIQKKLPDAVPEDMDIKVAKGKKKKKKVPPPQANLSGDSEFNVSFKGEAGQHSDRKAYRVNPRGMTVKLKGLDAPCPLLDLSVTGVGFQLKKPKLKRGNVISFEILDKEGVSLGMVKAKVMRHFEGAVGCCFKDPDGALEDKLHKIVLDAQKKPEGKSKGDDSMKLDFLRPETLFASVY